MFYFTIRLLRSSTCFEHCMLIIRSLNRIDAASGIVTLKISEWSKITSVHGLPGKFQNVQNSPSLLRPSGARQVLLSSNDFDELRRENRIALSCLIIVLCLFM